MLLKYEIKYIYVIFITFLFDIKITFRMVNFFNKNYSSILSRKIDLQRFANNFTFIDLSSQEHMTQLKIDRF